MTTLCFKHKLLFIVINEPVIAIQSIYDSFWNLLHFSIIGNTVNTLPKLWVFKSDMVAVVNITSIGSQHVNQFSFLSLIFCLCSLAICSETDSLVRTRISFLSFSLACDKGFQYHDGCAWANLKGLSKSSFLYWF